MSRMRTIKPEAATSESLAAVPRATRWTFGLFWTHCDDEGRALWNLRLIKAAIYPLDDDVTPDSLADEFADLERIGAVCRYTIDGKEYVHVPAFGDHQHPNRRVDSKLPPCPGGEGVSHVQQLRNEPSMPTHAQRSEDAVSAHEQLTPVVEGLVDVVVDVESDIASPTTAGVRPQTSTPPDRFDQFWDIYPRKTAKPDAKRAWGKAVKRAEPDVIIDGALRFKNDSNRDDAYTAHPATWLNRDSWNDPALPPRFDRSRPATSGGTHLKPWQ